MYIGKYLCIFTILFFFLLLEFNFNETNKKVLFLLNFLKLFIQPFFFLLKLIYLFFKKVKKSYRL